MQKEITIKDIARVLNVSIATVSRALQGSTNIRPETKKRILDVARDLNYSPNPIALSLRDNKTKTIGVIVPEIANNFFSKTIAGIEDVALENGYHVFICQTHESTEREKQLVQHLLQRRVDGIIISVSQNTTDTQHIQQLHEKKLPFVLFDRVLPDVDTNKVVSDDYTGALQATLHLLQNGYKRIGHLTLNKNLSITQNRLNGYKEALRQKKIPFSPAMVRYCNFDEVTITQAIEDLFRNKRKPDAIFVSSERLANVCLAVLTEMKIKVPAQVGIAAFSDNPLSALLNPSLTTVTQPCFDIGQQAAKLLIEAIENPESATKKVELNTSLVVRESSRKKPG